ncbi:MAG: hypothetical protein WC876_02050 [Candidatus Thermoplasmatota archaeon]|jgi:hypothetical protein
MSKTYVVEALVTISTFTRIEADSPGEAMDAALERPMRGLCHHCGGDREQDEAWVTSGELDGEPRDLKAVEET